MTIKLYGFEPTRSARAKWILDELQLDYQSIDGRGVMKTEEFKKLHPLQKIPVLVDGNDVIFESAAIATYLADKYDADRSISFAPGTIERAHQDQWSYFAMTEIDAYTAVVAKHTFFLPADQRIPEVVADATAQMARAAQAVEEHLRKQDYLVGNRFSVADVVLGYILNGMNHMRQLSEYPKCLAYLERLRARTASPLLKDPPFAPQSKETATQK